MRGLQGNPFLGSQMMKQCLTSGGFFRIFFVVDMDKFHFFFFFFLTKKLTILPRNGFIPAEDICLVHLVLSAINFEFPYAIIGLLFVIKKSQFI